jgi:carbamoyl-phosphate synthase small subunit
MAHAKPAPAPQGATGLLVLADGTSIWGRGFGAEGEAVGEIVFNTAMTGYQEVMTDPSYARQIITFTFPHIGNVGANYEDLEADNPWALGCVVREEVTAPSSWRAVQGFDEWMRSNGRIGLSGVDTRALTRRIREGGAPNGVIAHRADGRFDVDALLEQARAWPGLEGMDLAREVSCRQMFRWSEGRWERGSGYASRGAVRAVQAGARLAPTWWRSTMAPSATSSAIWPMPART